MRINIEDKLFLDYRFRSLVEKLGREADALFLCYRFWRVAAEHWGQRKPLSMVVITQGGFGALIDVGLAEIRGDEIYAVGSEDQFSWYRQACDRAQKGRDTIRVNKESKSLALDLALDLGTIKAGSRLRSPPTPAPAPAPTPVLDIGMSSGDDVGVENPLVQIWNQHCGKLPKVQKMSRSRLQQARARLREQPDREYWRGVVQKLAASKFCGGGNDRGWRANFDFLVRPNTHMKAVEGQYDGKNGGNGATIDPFNYTPEEAAEYERKMEELGRKMW